MPSNEAGRLNGLPGTDRLLLIGILLIGAALRLYDYHHLPFSYDEFSALFRTRMNTFSDLIYLGVVSTDTHPAGVQFFMWIWTGIFGEAAYLVKLPFVLSGVAAIYLAYKIARDWFSPSTGLLTALFVAFLQYPITFSQYARPYASGLFLALLFVWCLHKAWINPSRNKKWYVAGYVLAGVANAYNHHFSLFFIGLAALSGLFMVPRRDLPRLFMADGLIILFYLPHTWIFFQQLGKGGVESWLSKPSPTFFLEYLQYILHFSTALYVIAAGLFVLSITAIKKTWKTANRYRLHILFWLVVTYATAYYYSVFRNAVLQYSVLIFTFPFAVMLVFSYAGALKEFTKWTVVIVFGCVSIYTLVADRQHYRIQYQSVLEQTLAETARARHQYGDDEVACLTNISPKVQDYYANRYKIDPASIITFDSTTDYIELKHALITHPGNYLALGWVNIPHLEVLSVAREVFPFVLDQKNYYTGDFYLLSRNQPLHDSQLISITDTVIRLDSLSIYNQSLARGDTMLFDHNRLRMPGWLGFTTFIKEPLDAIVRAPENYILLSIEVENPQPDFESLLILEITRGEEVVYWTANAFGDFTRSDFGRCVLPLALKLTDLDVSKGGETIHFYLQNVDQAYYYVNYAKIEVLKGNPYLYSLFGKMPE